MVGSFAFWLENRIQFRMPPGSIMDYLQKVGMVWTKAAGTEEKQTEDEVEEKAN